ncbi:MAG: DsbC family protein [Desulfuromusa sp.]|nr:DsbC family protein [Desulfuromusa sp.]
MRLTLPLFLIIILSSLPAHATDNTDASNQKSDPQVLTKAAAIEALQGIQGEVVAVDPAEVSGLYRVAMKIQGKIVPIYLDASGSYLFSGNIIRIKDRKNLTEAHFQQLNPVDFASIPLDEGLTLGTPGATQQIIVFTDPHCPYCSKLHKVLHDAVKANPDLAFHTKLIPLKQSSKKISHTIICNKSMEQLEMAFSGQALPEASCETDIIEKNLALAQELGIHGTPTLILPNGQISPGYRPLEELLELIEENRAVTK